MSFCRPINPETGRPKTDSELTEQEARDIRTQIEHDQGNSTRPRASVAHDSAPLDSIEKTLADIQAKANPDVA